MSPFLDIVDIFCRRSLSQVDVAKFSPILLLFEAPGSQNPMILKIILGKKLRKRGGVVLRAPICSSKNTRNDNIRISFQNSFAKSIFLPTETWSFTHLFLVLWLSYASRSLSEKGGTMFVLLMPRLFASRVFTGNFRSQASHKRIFLVFKACWCMKAFGRFNLVPNSQNNFCFKVNFFKLSTSVFTSK